MSNGDPRAELDFTWDPAKAVSNLAKHAVAFAQVATVFADPLALTVFDEGHSEFEERWFTLGMDSAGKLLAVSHTYAATGAASDESRILLVLLTISSTSAVSSNPVVVCSVTDFRTPYCGAGQAWRAQACSDQPPRHLHQR